MRWSVLDRALIRSGQRPAEALRDTVRFARQVEDLGYFRFWVAEHHGVPGVAGSAPTVLAAAVASATERIRVGTGGVMLPNHRPLVVAEQFGVLESLFPGRVDMGLGRSVGFIDPVRRALGADKDAADRFGEQLSELLGWFEPGGPVHAVPAEGLRVPAYVLAVGEGASIAAAHGLPLVMAHLSDEERMRAALDRYRADFTPSRHGDRPYVIVAVNAAVAATREAAELLQVPEAWATVWSRTRGVFPPLDPPGDVLARELTERERRYFAQARAGQLSGTEEEMTRTLGRLVDRTGADELMLTLAAHDKTDRLDSYRRLARLAGLTPRGVVAT
ncbi:LLM class flavin-dependent oxidoreductase [Streptomyces johnsoniae]|uniref:LLM class flavin-dependent oxidoreductase n=1 Tax=Streptomyces johnsoniae TaxID=3075532 RepID=A0ABU2S6Q2_9ACTN|nr:LLM class flavin-dependent oxidoreductase [Streptomyces sp. DSM 41886]MDT0444651.1 LLM class flavin-dependent oxidoreductase [Streptomyces sp. DSM 41886]